MYINYCRKHLVYQSNVFGINKLATNKIVSKKIINLYYIGKWKLDTGDIVRPH